MADPGVTTGELQQDPSKMLKADLIAEVERLRTELGDANARLRAEEMVLEVEAEQPESVGDTLEKAESVEAVAGVTLDALKKVRTILRQKVSAAAKVARIKELLG